MRPEQPKYKTSDEVDFVVIGSGAAGGIIAKTDLRLWSSSKALT